MNDEMGVSLVSVFEESRDFGQVGRGEPFFFGSLLAQICASLLHQLTL